jgi:hypothetical protein
MTEIRAVDGEPKLLSKKLTSSSVGFASCTVNATRWPSRRM